MENLYFADVGMKLFFKNEVYGQSKKPGLSNHIQYEAHLLKNFALLVTEMAVGRRDTSLLRDQADIDPELRCILLESEKSVRRVEENEEKSFLSKKTIDEYKILLNRTEQENTRPNRK